jgi:C-terminal processing protease CtpA/Prc
VGDRILAVNGMSMIGSDHYEAVELLKASGQTLDMVVGREALKPILQVKVTQFLKIAATEIE